MLIDTARRLTAEEGLENNVTYQVGDAHHLEFGDGDFDIVTLHTLISHVDDPLQVLREARRVVRPRGTVAIFDGDYASLTFGYPDPAQASAVEDALRKVMVANPRVMRDMPRLLPAAGLELVDAHGVLYANIGSGLFWSNAAQAYSAVLTPLGCAAAGRRRGMAALSRLGRLKIRRSSVRRTTTPTWPNRRWISQPLATRQADQLGNHVRGGR